MPLADALLADSQLDPEVIANNYLNEALGITTTKEALDGAKYILMERFAEDAELIQTLRQLLWEEGKLCAAVVPGKENDGAKFSDYFEHKEPLKTTPSHRALAMFRGRNEGFLTLNIQLDFDGERDPCEGIIARHWSLNLNDVPAARWLSEVVRWTWKVKLGLHLEMDLLSKLREGADQEAIDVFSRNLKDLLLAAPAGPRATIGLDPGLRTGVKVAVIDATGKVVDHCTIFPTPPQKRIAESEAVLLALINKHSIELIAIGNGTASRETERFVADMLNAKPELRVTKVMVNESGASIYSASEYASRELPDLDVTIRGAVSIARRLQDPLAELVKIEPKSIGVGQYQHDVSQLALSRSLDAVIEDCVNAVGVDVNTASSALLTRVSGLNPTTAGNLVEYRDEHGMFADRAALKSVPRIGDKTYEQAAGFLRVMNGGNPLDRSAVHPESYRVVDKIVQTAGGDLNTIIGNSTFLKSLQAERFVDEQVGLPTIVDILSELDKPGRDPRPEFKTATFKEGVEKVSDLEPGMLLEGVVTNVTNFGAFVDVGVHQDGLVHISALADKFVKDPHEVVKAGDIIKVKVMDVDLNRKRIALSCRLNDDVVPQDKQSRDERRHKKPSKPTARAEKPAEKAPSGAFASAFANATKSRR